MRQYGFKPGHGYATEPVMKAARAYEGRQAEKEIAEQMESALHPAELRLIEQDAEDGRTALAEFRASGEATVPWDELKKRLCL